VKTKPVGILIVAATLLFAACSLTHKTEGPDDAAIKGSIQAKLFQDATLERRDIRVDSQKGVVTLTGAVASDMEKLAVQGLARGATGVTQVVEQLTVSDALAAQTSALAEPAASSQAPERPRESRHAQRVMASSEAESSEAVETPAPEPTPQPAAPAPTTPDTQIAQAQPAPTSAAADSIPRDGESDCSLDRAADSRGLSGGHHSTRPDLRPRQNLRRRL